MRSKTAFVAGIGTAYFFDPDTGRRRRHLARDRGLRALRRLSRLGVRKAKYTGGRAYGVLAVARRALRRRGEAAAGSRR